MSMTLVGLTISDTYIQSNTSLWNKHMKTEGNEIENTFAGGTVGSYQWQLVPLKDQSEIHRGISLGN